MKHILFLLILLSCPDLYAQVEFTFETGALWNVRNDVNIPNVDESNRFDSSSFDRGPFFHHRLEAKINLVGRHNLRLLYAPLSFSVNGQFDKNLNFDGTDFSAFEDTKVSYKFNSYRLSYVFNWFQKHKHKFDIGLSLKIRDANIGVDQFSVSANSDDLGFVPLLYFAYEYLFTDTFSFYTDADFAVAPQGRALDMTVKLRKLIFDNYFLSLGYRVLEGGADNEEVFTFSLVHYAVVDLNLRF